MKSKFRRNSLNSAFFVCSSAIVFFVGIEPALSATNVNVVEGGTKPNLIGAVGNDGNSNRYSFTEDPGNSTIAPSVIVGLLDSSSITLEASNNITITNAVDSSANVGNGSGLTLRAGNQISVSAMGAITTRGGAISLSANDPGGSATGNGAIFINGRLNTTGGGRTGGGVNLTVNGGTGGVNLGADITTAGAGNLSISSGSGGVFQLGGTTLNAGSGTISTNGGGGSMSFSTGELTTTSASANAVNLQNATTIALGSVTAKIGTLNLGTAGNITGEVSQNGGTAIQVNTLTGNTGGAVILTGQNQISNLGPFTANGAFRLTNLGNLAVTGTLSTSGGPLEISTGGAMSFSNTLTLSGNSTLTGNSLTLAAGGINGGGENLTLDFSTPFTMPGTISGVANFTSQKALNSSGVFITSGTQTYNGNLTLTGNSTLNGSSIHFASNLIGGGNDLTLQSSGNITLAGVASGLNDLAVTGGTLTVNGTLGSATVSVGTGATLNGSGTIAGDVTIQSGATLAPGNSIEALGTGMLNLTAGSTFAVELQTSLYSNISNQSSDLIFSTSIIDIDAGALLTLTDLGASMELGVGSKITLISYFGGWTDTELFTYDSAPLIDGAKFTFGVNQWVFDYDDTTGGTNFVSAQAGATRFVTMTVIPEPHTVLLGSLSLVGLLRRRR